MAKRKWSTPDFAGSGRFLVFPQDDPHHGDLQDIIQEQLDQGWDLVEIVGLNQGLLVSFAKRDSRDQSKWIYRITGERGLEGDFQENILNCGGTNWDGLEIVTVWCDYQQNVPMYVFREPESQYVERPYWENKVVERPVTDLQTLFASIAPLKRQGWGYRAHLAVPESTQWHRNGFYLVYLQRVKREPRSYSDD